jgi:hypothetical protein
MTCDPTIWDFILTATVVIVAWEGTQAILGAIARRMTRPKPL